MAVTPDSLLRPDRKRADARIRTADPFITSEVLYQLSYVGEGSDKPKSQSSGHASTTRRR
jgi:hypothetical protein